MEKLKEILTELKRLRTETELLLVEDNILMDCATRIYISQNIQKGKESNINKMQWNKEKFIPATDKQIFLMKQLDLDVTDKLSKQEAYHLIKQAKIRDKI
jgi:hypothetical protein